MNTGAPAKTPRVLIVSVRWQETLLDQHVLGMPCRLRLSDSIAPCLLDTQADDGRDVLVEASADGQLMILPIDRNRCRTEDACAPVLVAVGNLTYELHLSTEAAAGNVRRRTWNRKGWLTVAASLAVHVGLLFGFSVLEPPLGLPNGGVTDEQVELMRRYLNAAAEREAAVSSGSELAEVESRGAPPSYDRTKIADASFGLIGLLDSGSSPETTGRGAGLGTGPGFGAGNGRLGGSHRTRAVASIPHEQQPPREATRPQPTAGAPINPNGRFATTYRPGHGHLTAFDAAVARGTIPAANRELVADLGGDFAPDLPTPAREAMAFSTSLERAQLPPSGGSFHLRFAMQSAATPPDSRPPLSVHLVLDTSGSMSGAPLDHARQAARAVIESLRPTDHFSLVTFSTLAKVCVAAGPVQGRKEGIRKAIAAMEADGGTNIAHGLELAYREARSSPQGSVPVVFVVSDGRATEGTTASSQLSRLAVEAFQAGIQTSTFGVGVDFDGQLMSRVAADGAGGYYYVPRAADIESALTTELDKRLRPVATALEVRIRLGHGVQLLHVYGSERLSDDEARRVRATEVAADQHASRRDGIQQNRQSDQQGGLRFFIPAFAAADRHALLIRLSAPAGVGQRNVGVVEVRYKDRIGKKNATREIPISIGYANSDAESAATTDPSVTRTVQAYLAGESLLSASRLVAAGNHTDAVAELVERENILRAAGQRCEEPAFLQIADRLARLRSRVAPGEEPLALALLLETAGRTAL